MEYPDEILSERLSNERKVSNLFQERSLLLEKELAIVKKLLRESKANPIARTVPIPAIPSDNDESLQIGGRVKTSCKRQRSSSSSVQNNATRQCVFPFVSHKVRSNLVVEQEAGIANNDGAFEFLLLKVRDYKLNQIIVVYNSLKTGEYFTTKRQLYPILSQHNYRNIDVGESQKYSTTRFIEWSSSIGEKYMKNAALVVINQDLIAKLLTSKLGNNIGLGLSYLLTKQ